MAAADTVGTAAEGGAAADLAVVAGSADLVAAVPEVVERVEAGREKVMLSWGERVFGNRLGQSVAMWLTASRPRTPILQALRDSPQPPIWLFIVAGMALGLVVTLLLLTIPVSAKDFLYGGWFYLGGYGPFGGRGGFGGLGRW